VNDEANTIYSFGDFENSADLHGKDTCPLWELALLKQHYHPHVSSSVTTLVTNSTTDLLKDPSSILNVNDVGEVFEEYASREGRFNPCPKRPKSGAAYRKLKKFPFCNLSAPNISDNEVKKSLLQFHIGSSD